MTISTDDLVELLQHELTQRHEEGYDVSQIERRWKALDLPVLGLHRPVPDEARAAVTRAAPEMEALYTALEGMEGLATRRAAGPSEPSTLEEIRALRPAGPRRLTLTLSDDALRDRLLGAWLGRAAGCMLGKPVEGWDRDVIRAALEHAGEYPLLDYIHYPSDEVLAKESTPAAVKRLTQRPSDWYRGRFDRMARDDDMDYPLIALHLLERFGPEFITEHVGRVWQLKLPYLQVYTAERVAYRNLVYGLVPPQTATFRNPYREWIGAQIRADLWGWVCPGEPERAAELAFRDASLSHVKNGIYGEMLFAAAMAASFCVSSAREALEIGLTEIPAECRLAGAMRQTIRWCDEDGDFQRTTDRIHETYGHYHRIHTINNAALVVMGLLYAENPGAGGSLGAASTAGATGATGGSGTDSVLEDAICLTVMGGWDTDCTGATAGSIVGSLEGADRLPGKWVAPFNDRLESIVIGMTDNRFTDLADRTLVQAKRLALYHGETKLGRQT